MPLFLIFCFFLFIRRLTWSMNCLGCFVFPACGFVERMVNNAKPRLFVLERGSTPWWALFVFRDTKSKRTGNTIHCQTSCKYDRRTEVGHIQLLNFSKFRKLIRNAITLAYHTHRYFEKLTALRNNGFMYSLTHTLSIVFQDEYVVHVVFLEASLFCL